MTGYTPFAITKFTSGQFQYFQPWQAPEDAFNPLINAFAFRGVITKRAGTQKFGVTGRLRYTNNEKVTVGSTALTMSGTLAAFPIEIGGFAIKATEAGPVTETFLDNASNGILVGNLGGSGTIDYVTGAWSITTIAVGGFLMSTPIIATYTFTTTALNATPIMLLTEYVDEVQDQQFVFANDERRSAIFNTGTELFDPISTFNQLLYIRNGATASYINSAGFGWKNIAPYSISITDGTSTITDIPGVYPAGTFTVNGIFAAGSQINYQTGAITVNFTAPPSVNVEIKISGSLQGDYYTGSRPNLFNAINWRPNDVLEGLLYMTNNIDPITTFNGTDLSRPPYSITSTNFTGFINDITTCLDVKVYQNRLILVRPSLIGKSLPDAQSIRWSAIQDPTNLSADLAGFGGELSATTSDWIQAVSYLRDALVTDMDNSTFLFRFTNNSQDPFRFDKINSTKSTDSPYGSVEYDTRVTSMGTKGLCYCDGVNKDRYDQEVIDLFTDIDYDNFNLSQGKRFDALQQTWMIYSSEEKNANNINCDRVLVYNWMEDIWCQYEINLTCIGQGRTFQDKTWDDFAGLTWNQAFPGRWNLYFLQNRIPWLLGGDADGIVYFLNTDEFDKFVQVDDDPIEGVDNLIINSQMVSKRWNPFVEQGLKGNFGYIDFYYAVDANIVLTINYYLNNSNSPQLTQTMTLDAKVPDTMTVSDQDYNWKRMYCNLVGSFLRIEILSSTLPAEQGQFILAGMVLWARPAGRLTPGGFL